MPNVPDFVSGLFRKLAGKAMPANYRQSLYYLHPEEQLFIKNYRHDVAAPDAPTTATGQFIIMDFVVPKSQVLIVKGFAPYAMERTNVGGNTESARYIQPQDGNGWFIFSPQVSKGAPFLIESNLNAPQNLVLAPPPVTTDVARQPAAGIDQITVTPYTDAIRQMENPFFTMFIDSNNQFQVLFQLAGPASPTNPINNPYVIGNPTPPNQNKRVDFAGVYVAGLLVNKSSYTKIADLFREEG